MQCCERFQTGFHYFCSKSPPTRSGCLDSPSYAELCSPSWFITTTPPQTVLPTSLWQSMTGPMRDGSTARVTPASRWTRMLVGTRRERGMTPVLSTRSTRRPRLITSTTPCPFTVSSSPARRRLSSLSTEPGGDTATNCHSMATLSSARKSAYKSK